MWILTLLLILLVVKGWEVCLVGGESGDSKDMDTLIMLAMDWEINSCRSYHDANVCVDALCNIRSDQETILMFQEHCLAQVKSLYLADLLSCHP